MNGDAKSPQHTVVHPMYVSYSSIPTSASATMLSNKHHQHTINQTQISNHHQPNNSLSHHPCHHLHQQTNNKSNNNNNNNNNNINNNNTSSNTNSNSNSNTFLIHTNNSGNHFNHNNYNSNKKACHSNPSYTNTPNASKNNTLSRMLYSPRTNKIASCASSQTPQQYYDDSTAKADQLYTHSNRRQMVGVGAALQQHIAQMPGTPERSTHATTTPSLSYASLQNSNLNLGCMGMNVGGPSGGGIASPLSNSNYSLTNSMNNNTFNNSQMGTGTSSGRFARINTKPRPPKSTSYSSFKSGLGGIGIGTPPPAAAATAAVGVVACQRPDVKYTQMSHEEGPEEDNFSLQNFKAGDGVTYVPFQSPTPTTLFINQQLNNNNNNNNDSNNASYASLISPGLPVEPNNNTDRIAVFNQTNYSPNNNSVLLHDPFLPVNGNEVLLENGAVLYPATTRLDPLVNNTTPPVLNAANRFIYQQNGLPFHPAYSPTAYRRQMQPTRPTNIPLPRIPTSNSFTTPLSPSEVTPPPPPAPRPHIFQPRSGHAPYPDLSPDVTEKYAMPTQYIPRSPVATRIARRQRQQQQERAQHSNTSANFCDQIRDAPPGYVDTGFNIVRAKSHDRLTNSQSSSLRAESKATANVDAAPHVNRRSGRRDNMHARPRSYCNSIVGGEGVIRTNIAADRELSGVAVATGGQYVT